MSKIFIDTDELAGLARDIKADATNLAEAGLEVVRVRAELEAMQATGQLPQWSPEQATQMNRFTDAVTKLGGGLTDIADNIQKYAGSVQNLDLAGGFKPGIITGFVLGAAAGWVGVPTKGEVSSKGRVGWGTSGQGSTNIGGVKLEGGYRLEVGAGYDASASYSINERGISGRAAAGGFVGVQAEAWGSVQYGPLTAKGHTEFTAGSAAEAEALGQLGWGKDGPQAEAGLSGSAIIGNSWNADASADFGFGQATAGAGFKAGLGVEFDVGVSFGADNIGFRADIGASLGIGLELEIDISINPSEIIGGAFDFGSGIITDPFGSLDSAFSDIGGAFGDIGSTFADLGSGIGGAFEDLGSGIGSAAEDFVGGLGDALGSLF